MTFPQRAQVAAHHPAAVLTDTERTRLAADLERWLAKNEVRAEVERRLVVVTKQR